MNDVSFEADGFEDQRSVLPVRTPLVSRTAARKKQWRRGLFAFAAACLVGTCAQGQTSFGRQNVGVSSAAQSVTVTAQVAGQVSTVEVLTLGTSGLDFAPGSGGATCASANLMAGQSCTQSITFTPTSPGQRNGAVVLLDSGGGVLGTAYLTGTGSAGLGVFVPGTMLTVAGDGQWTSVLDGKIATAADLDLPSSVVEDGSGNLYIADSAHNRIREVTASTGIISTIAGNGNPSYQGDNGSAVNATLNTPSGITIDGAGNLYIADTGNNVIRKITAATGIITTAAGNGNPGNGGDGGPATSANLSAPWGVTADSGGNLYIADTANHRIQLVAVATGVITTVAGDGVINANGAGSYSGDGGPAIAAGLNFPYAVAFDPSGNMYIPDSSNNRIREVSASTGIITTFAGTGALGFSGDGAAATAAQLYSPSGVAFDPAGNLYIADTQNNRIRKVSSVSGNITTIAGNGAGVYSGDNGSAAGAGLYGPYGLYIDGNGDLFIADYFDHRIREIQSNLALVKLTAAVRQGDTSAPASQTIENDGNAALDLTAITPDQNAAVDAALTTCTLGTPYLIVDAHCVVAAEFAPSEAGNPLTANVDISGSTVNAPLDIQLVGDATAVNTTTVTLVSSLNPANFGQTVTLTATVTTGAGTGSLTGTVAFTDGATVLAASLPLHAGVATFTTTAFAVGLHSLTASYSGDAGHFASTSTPALSQIVNEATVTSLTSSANPSQGGANVTFTAVVAASSGGGVAPDGNVIFSDGATVIGTAVLSGSGIASFSTTALANGTHSITAAYGGDAANYILGSSSNVVTQNVQGSSTTVLNSAPNPSNFGTPVTLVAAVTPTGSVAATGAVNFFDGGIQIGSVNLVTASETATLVTASLATGQHSITAAYQGGPGNSASTSAPVIQVVNQAQTATTLSAVPDPGIAGKAVVITATVTVTQGKSTPTGTVTFTDGATTLGQAPLSAAGTATLSPLLAAGPHSLVATYAGDANDAGSVSAALALTVQLGTTTTAVASTPNPSLVQASVTYTATVTGNGGTPTGEVSFLADGVSIGTAKLNASGSASLQYANLPVGSHAITASYSGDATDSASTSTAINQVVQAIPTVTALGTSITGATNSQIVLVATVIGTTGPTPTGTVTFTSGTTVIGSSTLDAGGVATLTPELPNGTYSIVAAYGGDALHSPSTSNAASISTSATNFNLSVTPDAVTMASGQNATVTVTLESENSFSDTIGLGCASLPAAVNCHFSTISESLKAGAVDKVQLTIDTNNPLSGGTVSTNSRADGQGKYLAGLLFPVAGVFGWLFWKRRKRHAILFHAGLVLLLLSSAGLLVTGCGGFTQSSATPGTYTIQVTGVGTNSNITRYQNITLNITK